MQDDILQAFGRENKTNPSKTDGVGCEPHKVVSVPSTVDQI